MMFIKRQKSSLLFSLVIFFVFIGSSFAMMANDNVTYFLARNSFAAHYSIFDGGRSLPLMYAGISNIRLASVSDDSLSPEEVAPPEENNIESEPEVAKDLDDAFTIFQSAEESWKAHKWGDALDKYEIVTRTLSPYTSRAHIAIGRFFKYHGRWNEALTEFDEAIATALRVRDIEDAMTSIGAVYISKGDYPTALSVFEDIIEKTEDWQQFKYSRY